MEPFYFGLTVFLVCWGILFVLTVISKTVQAFWNLYRVAKDHYETVDIVFTMIICVFVFSVILTLVRYL